MVSIIIRGKDQKNLSQTIDSILKQKNVEFEMLLLNLEYQGNASSQIKKIQHSGDYIDGILQTVKMAKGEYVMFCDESLRLDKLCISTLMHKAVSSGADIVECGYYNIKNNDIISVSNDRKEGIYSSADAIKEMCDITPCASEKIFISRAIFSGNLYGKLVKKQVFNSLNKELIVDDETLVYNLFKVSNKCFYIGNNMLYRFIDNDNDYNVADYEKKTLLYKNDDIYIKYLQISRYVYAVKTKEKEYLRKHKYICQGNKDYINMFRGRKHFILRVISYMKYLYWLRKSDGLDKKMVKNFFQHNKKQKIFLIGAPTQDNSGDQAILIAEEIFLRTHYPNKEILVFSERKYYQQKKYIKKFATSNDIFAFHGGGNIGDTYKHIEDFRRKVIKTFSNNKIFIFPQTSYFSKSSLGMRELKKSRKVYSNSKNLCIFARELQSYKFMKKEFIPCSVELCPDIVLYLDASREQIERNGVLLCLRTDIERKLSISEIITIKDQLADVFEVINSTDMHAHTEHTDENRYSEFQRKINTFKRSECVVTDRLHGMIFAAITGTPCVVLGNHNHKVKSGFKWLEKLGYICFDEDLSMVRELAIKLKNKNGHLFNNSEFKPFYSKIDNYIGER